VFGNNVYGSARYNVFFTSNADDIHTLRGNDGGPIPDLSYGGLHSRASHATILAEGSGGVFRWFGTGMEYSSPIINASNNLFEFHGSQLEKAGLVDSGINGPFFRNTAATDSIGIVIIGGNIVFSDPSGTDADMIDLRVGGSANVIISGTRVSSRHSVTSLLLAKFGNPGVSSIDVSVVNDGANVGPPSSNCLNTSYQTAGATGYSRTMPAVFLDSGGPSGTAPSPVILRMRAQSAPVEFGTFWDGGAGAWGERFSGATVWALRADQSGRVGVNRSSPSNTYFGVEGLPTYSNNAGARAAGLVPGDCYLVTDSDPRQLAVVF
jgi:hypothetical protein